MKGKFAAQRTIARIEQLLALGRIAVERSTRGVIRFAYEKKIDGSTSLM